MRYKIFLRAFALLLIAFSAPEVWAGQIAPTFADIEYAKPNGISLKLDIYLPQNISKPYPVIVFVHGGGWRGGSKEDPPTDFLVLLGYAVVSINYRLSQQALFPAQIYDCKAAIRWIRANAAQYGFDPLRIGAWGGSAGGHLVALLGTTVEVDSLEGRVGGNLQFSSEVQAVCDWYGPANFLTICDYPSTTNHCSSTSPEAQLIGGAIPDNPQKAWAASPIAYVSKNDPPFLIMHSTGDMAVPFHQSVEMDSALRQVGVKVTFKPVIGNLHGVDVFSNDSTRKAVADFFDRQLKTPTTVENNPAEIARKYYLEQNYPNPFSASGAFGNAMTIRFSLPLSEHATLKVFDVTGREIKTLVDGRLPAGQHDIAFDATALPSGVYFYQLKTASFSQTRKAVVRR